MGMTIQRRKDTRTPRFFMHKIADVRGGVSVCSTELGSDFLQEGSVVSTPESGICHIVKIGEVVAAVAASDTVINVKKGTQFISGDIVLATISSMASTITAIDKTNKDYDTITIDAALGTIAVGGFIAQADKAQTTSGAKLKYTPFAVVGTGKPVIANQNIDTDAWLIGVTKGNPLPTFVSSVLTGIINY